MTTDTPSEATEIIVTVEMEGNNALTGEPIRQRIACLDAAHAVEAMKGYTAEGLKIVGVEERPRKTYKAR
jgi:hypothetical protein